MSAPGVDWQVVYVILTVIAIVAMAVLGAFGWRFRHAEGSKHFLFLILSGLGWSLLVLVMAVAPPSQTVTWLKAKYLFIQLAPVALFLYALKIAGLMPRRQPLLVAALLIVPLATQGVVWAPGTFPWMVAEVRVARVGILSHLDQIVFGPFYWVGLAQGYALILLAIGGLAVSALRANVMMRGQLAAMAVAGLAPLITNFLLVAKIAPREYDPMPFGVLIMCATIAWAILRHRMIDLVPVARNRLMDVMANGVLATDGSGRVIDCNPAMAGLLRQSEREILGQPLAQVLGRLRGTLPAPAGIDALEQVCAPMSEARGLAAPQRDLLKLADRHFAAHLAELPSARAGASGGCLLILDDVTERVHAEAGLNQALAMVKTLRGLLPICAGCKKIQDRFGRWQPVDEYIAEHSEADLTHSICPGCLTTRYPGFGTLGSAEARSG